MVVQSRSESPLSDLGSDAFPDSAYDMSTQSDISDLSDHSPRSAVVSLSTPHISRPPKKRRKIIPKEEEAPTPRSANFPIVRSPSGSISSDTSGEVPTSPSFAQLATTHPLSSAYAAAQANPNDPDSSDQHQVTQCQWNNCPSPDQGNMDRLVQHIADVHIPPRQKQYKCDWDGCPRKAMTHTSAYALKAHMRSHTKEKPFMCQVPECDRSFTRSDALAKHMRTVHETEALRPSDPVPRNHTGGISTPVQPATANGNGFKKLKLTMGKKSSNGESAQDIKIEGNMPVLPTAGMLSVRDQNSRSEELDQSEQNDPELQDAVHMDAFSFPDHPPPGYFPKDFDAELDDYERRLPPSQLYRLLKKQTEWASEEQTSLTAQLKTLRMTTDDMHGDPITKLGLEEDIPQAILMDEWTVVQNLLDKITNVELAMVGADESHANSNLNGTLAGAINEAELTNWRRIRALPF